MDALRWRGAGLWGKVLDVRGHTGEWTYGVVAEQMGGGYKIPVYVKIRLSNGTTGERTAKEDFDITDGLAL